MNKHNVRVRRGLRTKAVLAKSELPRLVVFRSGKHIYGQIVKPSDCGDVTLASSSTLSKGLELKGSKVEQAFKVGTALAGAAKKLDIKKVCFDRSGYKYHGRVMALAKGAREAGLEF